MKIRFNLKTILYFLVLAWLIFSVYYIANNIWNVQLNRAYQQGAIDVVDQLIKQTEDCQPIPLFNEDKQIQIISLDCITKKTEDGSLKESNNE